MVSVFFNLENNNNGKLQTITAFFQKYFIRCHFYSHFYRIFATAKSRLLIYE